MTRGLFAVHAAVVLFGLSGLFGKMLPLAPLTIVWWRCLFAALALGLAAASTGRLSRPPKAIILVGSILAAHWATFFHAIQISTVAIGLLSFSIFPILVAVIEPVFLPELDHVRRPDARSLASAIIACGGVAVVFAGEAAASTSVSGAAWGAVSGLLYAVTTVMNRAFVRSTSALTIGLYQNLVAMALLLPFNIMDAPSIDARSLGLVALLGVIFTGAAHTLFIHGMKDVSARTASLIGTLEPVYGVIAAFILIREVPKLTTLAGGLIIVFTLLISARRAT